MPSGVKLSQISVLQISNMNFSTPFQVAFPNQSQDFTNAFKIHVIDVYVVLGNAINTHKTRIILYIV